MRRLFVFSNLATTVDGKIAPASRGSVALGSLEDRREMRRLRAKSDAILMGASTLRACRHPLRVDDIRVPGLSAPATPPWNVVLSSRLEGISPDWSFFREPSIHRVLFVGPRAPEARVARFRSTCEIRRLKAGAVGPQIVRSLERSGIRRLLVEGGGATLWEFASTGLLARLHVTLTPGLLGGAGSPTLLEGAGFERPERLRLERLRRRGSELFLVYRVAGPVPMIDSP